MKANLTLLFVCLLISVTALSQNEVTIAKAYLSQNAEKEHLLDSDIDEMIISSEYLSPTTGWYHIYFNQTYQSIEVYNGMLNATLQNGEVKYLGNTFVANIASFIPKNSTSSVKISPVQAIQAAVNLKNLAMDKPKQSNTIYSNQGELVKVTFTDKTLSDENIQVKKYWLPYESTENGTIVKKVALTWNVQFLTKDHQNQWNMHVDVATGDVLQERDDIIHCSFGASPDSVNNGKDHRHLAVSKSEETGVANSYNVFDYPLENPNSGARTIVTSPYTRFAAGSTGPGATNGWHNDGTVDYTTTRGNNVWAKEDLAADNETTIGTSPISATLEFNYPYSQTLNSAAANKDAAITNLFYWNNLMHDGLYKYGFDEPSGNFQNDNQGRGGLAGDFVYADAQDGLGLNNANFYTPVDGGNGRMQMYLFSDVPRPPGTATYQPDGDFGNGIIAHEYGHGWSIRLTGGPNTSGCLSNTERASEGWSDYLGLMFTTDWSSLTPSLASANISRTIGSYAFGAGIRPFPYSYDKASVNNSVTYGKIGDATNFSIPHGIGSIWATMLWDMTWEIIFQDSQIVGNIYDTPANITDMKGNVAALKLVNEGLRLQPCNPSFIQARDAILKADIMLFNGRYGCSISKAFARRGLGANASTGNSANDRVVIEDFTPFSLPILTSPILDTVCSNQPFSYVPTVGVSGTYDFKWTRAAKAGINNSANDGSGTINETLINSTLIPITVTYLISVSPGQCDGSLIVPQSVKVTVNPSVIPTVSEYSVCLNGSVPVGEGLKVPVASSGLVSDTILNGLTYVRAHAPSGVTTTFVSSGVTVFYKPINYIAPFSGSITFEVTAAALTDPNSQDTFLSLYKNTFDPSNPAINFLSAVDDGAANYRSSLAHTLEADSSYVLVVSTYSTGITGTFSLQSSYPGFSGGVNSWYVDNTTTSILATGELFNPVGLAGSGIANTASLGTNLFYVSTQNYGGCRTAVSFNIGEIGGRVSSDAVRCNGTNTGTLELTGHTGNIIRWESSLDDFSTMNTIANTTTSLTFSNVSQTTKFRAVVDNGSCTSNSIPATVVINPGRIYVNKNATGLNNGLSWPNAFSDLQRALISGCTSSTEIWVAKGTYRPTNSNGDKAVLFSVYDNLKVYGGFAGTEANLVDRNYSLINTSNLTTLTGDLNGDDGKDFANNAENSYIVMSMSNVSNNTRLDGFTVSGGNNVFGATPSGAGLHLFNSSPQIANCIFSGNNANNRGGGIINFNGSPTIENCSLIGNKSAFGAAVYNYSYSGVTLTVTISNSTFINNSSPSNTGAILYNVTNISGSNLVVNLTNCSSSGNTAVANGNAIYNWAITAGNTITNNLKNCAFFNNGGPNSFKNETVNNLGSCSIIATNSLVESSVSGFTGTNNHISDISPFVSATDLHLSCTSPAANRGIATGVPSLDLDGNARPFTGTLVDIGAYELQGNPVSNPTVVSTNATQICSGSPISLSGNCSSGVLNWYNQFVGGTSLGTGTNLAQSPSVNTTFYAACQNDFCESPRVATQSILVAIPSVTPLVLNSDYSTGQKLEVSTTTISASNKVISPASVIYKAGNSISLNNGFEAGTGSIFKAEIGGCD